MAREEAEDLTKPKVKIPKTPAAVADLMYKTRQERYTVNKEVDRLQAIETACSDFLIETLPISDATGIRGKFALAAVQSKTIGTIENFDKFWEYLKKQPKNLGAVFLQRRLNQTAVDEIWATKKPVPGVGKVIVKKISLTKV